MITSKNIREAMGSAPTVSQLKAEILELVDEVLALNLTATIDEGSDVAWFVYAIAYDRTGLVIPAVGAGKCWAKFLARRQVWEDIFAQHGLVYHPRYTAGGTNFNRPEKVSRAINLARQEQS